MSPTRRRTCQSLGAELGFKKAILLLEDGWAAIQQAIYTSGFKVVKCYPVHGELKVSTTKSSSSSPISLDAIIVCCKRKDNERQKLNPTQILQKSKILILKLESAGIVLSASDRFVIHASQMLVPLSTLELSYEEVTNEIRTLALV